MLESDDTVPTTPTDPPDQAPAPRKRAPRKTAAKAAPTEAPADAPSAADAPVPRKRAPRKAAATKAEPQAAGPAQPAEAAVGEPARRSPAKRTTKKAATATAPAAAPPSAEAPPATKATRKRAAKKPAAEPAGSVTPAPAAEARPAMAAPGVLFMPPAADEAPPKRRRVAKKAAGAPAEAPPAGTSDTSGDAQPAQSATQRTAKKATRQRPAQGSDGGEPSADTAPAATTAAAADGDPDEVTEGEDLREAAIEQATGARRRRRRGRRGRGGGTAGADSPDDSTDDSEESDTASDAGSDDANAETDGPDDSAEPGESGETANRRRRRRRRSGSGGGDDDGPDDPPNTVTHVREPKKKGGGGGSDDGVKGVKGSTRLEAKRQRRRDGRDTTRRRAPILTESEFLARREAVDRVMAVRQNGDRTQIAVLEDDILVEHYVTRASASSYVGNVYFGRVQNVLPSMEAAFIDIGKGRNGVLYAGEVNWDAAGLEGKSRAIEQALKSGDPVLVQVTKDPIGHKGARLTSQVSLPGRFLVYVPGGGMTGISRRLPDTERHRLKSILKQIVPEDAGVIVRTAAEGASEEDLTHDVERLQAQWEKIQQQAGQTKSAPVLVHGEPDLAIRVVRDVFNEDFTSLVVQGDDAWTTISEYVEGVAPDLAERSSRHTKDTDLFHDLRVDEQLMKALDRKVWLPSGGSLVIDRTEAMTVVDVNTGKYIGSGGNLEQTVTRNNIEAAEEIVRQLRLRDVGGMIVIDFIDMVLESNRDLVLRRLTECLGRDRTKHQVAEVTSLGLVQMTRKRVGEGLLEAFSEPCEVCRGRGVIVHGEPVDQSDGGSPPSDEDRPKARKRRARGGAAEPAEKTPEPPATSEQRQAATAAIAAIHRAANGDKPGEGEAGGLDELASGLVAAALDAESASQPPAGEPAPVTEPEPRAEPRSRSRSRSRPDSGPEPTPAAEPTPAPALAAYEQSATSVAVVENGAGPAPMPESGDASEDAPAPGRRRRRSASRPAGPPTGG